MSFPRDTLDYEVRPSRPTTQSLRPNPSSQSSKPLEHSGSRTSSQQAPKPETPLLDAPWCAELPMHGLHAGLLQSMNTPPDSEVSTPHGVIKSDPHQWWENHHQTRPLVPGVRPRTKSWQRRRTGYQSGHYSQPQLVFPPVARARRCVTSMDDLANQDDLHHMLADMCRKTKHEGPTERDTTRLLMLRQELARLCDRRIGKSCDEEHMGQALHPTFGVTPIEEPVEELNGHRVLLSRTRKHRRQCRKTFSALYDSDSVATLCSGQSIPTVPRPEAPDAYGRLQRKRNQLSVGQAGMLTSPIPSVQRQLEALKQTRERMNAEREAVSTPERLVSTPNRTKFTNECLNRKVLPMTGLLEKMKKDPKHINLSKMRLGDRLGEVLANELEDSEYGAEHLDLSHNGMSEKGCSALMSTICDSGRLRESLVTLKLSGNRVGNYGVEQIAEFCRQSSKLEVLELDETRLGGYGTGWLMSSLAPSKTLTRLTLQNNSIGEKGVEEIAELIQDTKCLKDLDLSYNNLRRKPANSIMVAVGANKSLTKLNLAWNALADEGAARLAGCLETCATLTELNLASNRIRAGGAMAVAAMLKYNTVLRKVVLDQNPLEGAGGNALLGALLDPGLPNRTLCIKGCDLSVSSVTPSQFSPDRPTGTYSLSLGDPVERALVVELHRHAQCYEDQVLKNVKLDNQSWSGLEGPVLKRLPMEGSLECVFEESLLKKMPLRAVPSECLGQLVSVLHGVDHSSRLRVLWTLSLSYTFHSDQLQKILAVFDFGANQMDALGCMFGQICDQKQQHELVESLVGDVPRLEQLLGVLYDFNRSNPCGHYVLHLDNPHHVVVLKHLGEISARLAQQQAEAKGFDVSQHSNLQAFRNESYELDLVEINTLSQVAWRGQEIDLARVNKGILEFDFVPIEGPAADQEAMVERKFDKWCKAARKLRKETKELLRWVKWEMMDHCLTIDQLIQLLESAAMDDGTRLSIVMMCWTRVVDHRKHSGKLLARVGPLVTGQLRRQLGQIQLFSPSDVDRVFNLDFRLKDERLIAQYLIELALHEMGGEEGLKLPGTLLQPEAEDPDELKNVPGGWLVEFPDNLPTQGTWNVEYASDIPVFDTEAVLAQQEAKLEAQQEKIAADPNAELEEVEMDPHVLEEQHIESALQKLAPYRVQLAVKLLGMKHLLEEE